MNRIAICLCVVLTALGAPLCVNAQSISTVTGSTPEQFHDILKSELAKFGKLVREAGIKGESAH